LAGKLVILIDLPVFPKGVLSLSLPAVAACFPKQYQTEIIDLNLIQEDLFTNSIKTKSNIAFIGFKVSAQNIKQAIHYSGIVRQLFPNIPLLWGGELPSLLPQNCLEHADTVVQSLFESIADAFIADLENNNLKPIYTGTNKGDLGSYPPPALHLIDKSRYYNFMGIPLETSRGCSEVCAFCMVHTMQKKTYFCKGAKQLQHELEAYNGSFVNVIDYNIGVDATHVITTAKTIKSANVHGWMAEMCIESLDNEEVLIALKESGCRMIYCGLESIDTVALKGVHKMNTNHVENYERIIRKAQKYGIQVASGFILGINGMNENTFKESLNFFHRMGIIYVKLTFLTYNPGTKVAENMKKKGSFLSEDISVYDGVHLSYLPNGVEADVVLQGAVAFIRDFYSIKQIILRSFNTKLGFWRRIEFILFNYLYREPYLQLVDNNAFLSPDRFSAILNSPFKKNRNMRLADKLLTIIRNLS
jgi:radical SAM superfamily enzyme YgiQ (UPF0313 family)